MKKSQATPETTVEVDGDEIDPKSAHYLRTVVENDGEATTSEIRERAALSKSEVHYRHKKLRDLGVVEIETPDERGGRMYDGKTPNVVRLTDVGRRLVEQGDVLEATTHDGVEHLKNRIEGLRGRMKQSREELERRLSRVESTTDDVADLVDGTIADELEANRAAIVHTLDRLDRIERRLEEEAAEASAD